jgi:ribosome-binding factor A
MTLRKKERLADAIKAEVSRIILFELTDPRIGFVTVTGVEMAADLHSAKVKISVMGDEKVRAVTMSVITHARGHIQKELGDRIRTRFVPEIRFEEDDSVRKSVELLKTLRRVAEE